MNIESKITSVTVYSDRAQITRCGKVELKQGVQTLIFDDLPDEIEKNSIQVKGSKHVVLKDIKFETIVYEDIPDSLRKELFEEKQKYEYDCEDLTDKLNAIASEKNFIQNISLRLTNLEIEKENQIELEPEKWMKMVMYYRQKFETLDEENRKINRQKNTIEKKINQLQEQINQLNYKTGKKKNRVTIIVDATGNSATEINLEYIIYGTRWFPVYDIRVDSFEKKMVISYSAIIQQSTGENWENVSLRISTAKPQISGTPPKLSPWYIKNETPDYDSDEMESVKMDKVSYKKKALPNALAGKTEAQKEMESLLKVPTTEVATNATSVLFNIPDYYTIKSDNTPHRIGILIHEFDAQFQYIAIPKLSPYAYLKAKVKNLTDFPLLPGETHIFLNGAFVANSRLELTAPNQEFWTSLGVDESIKIEHKFVNKYEKDEGLFTKKRKINFDYLIIIKNNKQTNEDIVISDQIPISRDGEINVELIEPKYKEDTPTLKKLVHDVFEWTINLKANQEVVIPFKFSVEAPRDSIIVGIDY